MSAFCWHNLRTHDVETARRFYTALFGWKTKKVDAGAFKHVFRDGKEDVAGLAQITPWEGAAPAHWLAFVAVDDLDATLARAEALGAALLWGPQEIEGIARFAVMRDPQGAVFGLWLDRRARGREL